VSVPQAGYRVFYADHIPGRESRRARAYVLACTAGALITTAATLLAIVGVFTAFRARWLYARGATLVSRTILRLYGIDLRVHGAPPWPSRQTVYVSNHTSSLDLFVLVALGLPNTRFFLSGFLRRVLPLGVISWMMGTFFTVPQSKPAERTQIFRRAGDVLSRTRESVYLSPEGERVTTGTIGHFNKGAFHLATTLRAPIVPIFIHIPSSVDPRRGLDARPGCIDVYVLPAIDTSDWRVSDLIVNKERVRDVIVRFQEARTWA
jgi:1-acyl-sn-glycerol-3-phosphate acyltransferase